MRILGIDYGGRRHGLALSDALGITAQPYGVLEQAGEAADVRSIQKLIAEHDIGRIVIGLPLNMDGGEAVHSEDVRRFQAKLEESTGLPVELWEERLTTAEAERILLAADISRRKRKRALDKMAAAIILQSWMDAHQHLLTGTASET